jgi:hypothetical protein
MQHAWERGEMHTIFWFEKPEEKRQLVRSRRRWKDNIRMYLREIG